MNQRHEEARGLLASNPLERLARKLVFRNLKGLQRGLLTIRENGRESVFGNPEAEEFILDITVHDPRAYWEAAFGGTTGAGKAYVEGYWSCNDLTALVRLFAIEKDSLFKLEGGWAKLSIPIQGLVHSLRRNTRNGSRKNISAHYDLGNDFYSLFLDSTMAYSSGFFEDETSTLEQASIAKFERIGKKLALEPGDHVLEIGTGWGGLAEYIAKRFGCRVTTTTLSSAQFEGAKARIRRAGLEDRVLVLQHDYRDLEGVYDKIISIEMIEAVGHHYHDRFFDVCADRLRPGGSMLVQAITIADTEYERHRKEVDFIKRYVFPGSCIPSITRLCESMTRSSDLRLHHLEDITSHYVKTLRLWRSRFYSQLDRVRALGYSDTFIRMWEFYLSYCEGGFAERYIGDVQMVLVKPGFRESHRIAL